MMKDADRVSISLTILLLVFNLYLTPLFLYQTSEAIFKVF
jgi:hypothetical protein